MFLGLFLSPWIIGAGAVACILAVIWQLHNARGLVKPLPGYQLTHDARQPVLYLREFAADYTPTENGRILAEDVLLRKFDLALGPVLALAAPGLPYGTVAL